jgi:antitoxin component of MazEF toxin-antitoxin module
VARPVKVKKWGKGLALIIPREFAATRDIRIGSVIDLENVRVLKRRRYKLSELLAGFKRVHRHGEWKLGEPLK